MTNTKVSKRSLFQLSKTKTYLLSSKRGQSRTNLDISSSDLRTKLTSKSFVREMFSSSKKSTWIILSFWPLKERAQSKNSNQWKNGTMLRRGTSLSLNVKTSSTILASLTIWPISTLTSKLKTGTRLKSRKKTQKKISAVKPEHYA